MLLVALGQEWAEKSYIVGSCGGSWVEVGVHVIRRRNSGPLMSALRVAPGREIQKAGQQWPTVGSVMEVFGW